MKRFTPLLLFIILILNIPVEAFASPIKGFRYSLFTGAVKSRTEFKTSNEANQFNSPWVIPNGGVGFEIRFKSFTVEIDGIIVKHRFQFIDATLAKISTIYTWSSFQVPLLVQIHWGRKLSFGAGMYGEYALGKIFSQSSTPTVIPNKDLSFGDFGLRRWDYGWVIDSMLNLPIKKKIGLSFRVNGRVTQGLAELSTLPGKTRRLADFQLFVGFSLGKMRD